MVDQFIGYFTRCFLSGILSAVWSLIFLGVQNKVGGSYWFLFLIWLGVLTFFIGSAYIVIGIMLDVLRLVLEGR